MKSNSLKTLLIIGSVTFMFSACSTSDTAEETAPNSEQTAESSVPNIPENVLSDTELNKQISADPEAWVGKEVHVKGIIISSFPDGDGYEVDLQEPGSMTNSFECYFTKSSEKLESLEDETEIIITGTVRESNSGKANGNSYTTTVLENCISY